MLFGILLVLYLVWKVVNWPRPELTLTVGELHSVPLYNNPRDERRDVIRWRLKAIRRNMDKTNPWPSINNMRRWTKEVEKLNEELRGLR